MMITPKQAITALEATENLRFHLKELIKTQKQYDSRCSMQQRARQTLKSRALACRFYKGNFEISSE
jgi:hypothetical protein